MGTVFRKQFTKPIPCGAEIIVIEGKRFARWKDRRGKLRREPLSDGREDRISVVAKTYTACYRDGGGIVRETSTGCKDATAAKKVLSDLEKRAEKVKSGITTANEDAAIDYQRIPLADLIEPFVARRTKRAPNGLCLVRQKNSRSRLRRLFQEFKFQKLSDLRSAKAAALLDNWMTAAMADDDSPGNVNEFRLELVLFGNWCVRKKYLPDNPFASVPRADAKIDQRRKRRALTETELTKLLDVARRRPLEESQMIRRGKDKGKLIAKVRPEVREQLELLGRERALIYKTLVLTGLRKGELASLTTAQLYLDGSHPYADLNPIDEKNREGSQIPLRLDLASDLRDWIAGLASRFNEPQNGCLPLRAANALPGHTAIFNVPTGLLRILDRDLIAAGIPKRDERGRTVDVHAMRHSFGTLLSKGGVSPRTARAAMRHSTIDLTMNMYTDPKLLDVHGALDSLPSLPLSRQPAEAQRATGTDGEARTLAVTLAVKSDNSCQTLARTVKAAVEAAESIATDDRSASAEPVNTNSPLTSNVNGLQEWSGRESNPRPLHCERKSDAI